MASVDVAGWFWRERSKPCGNSGTVASDDQNITAHYPRGPGCFWNLSQPCATAHGQRIPSRRLERSPLQQTLYRDVRARRRAQNWVITRIWKEISTGRSTTIAEQSSGMKGEREGPFESRPGHAQGKASTRRLPNSKKRWSSIRKTPSPSNAWGNRMANEARLTKQSSVIAQALKLDRDSIGVHTGLANMFAKQGQVDEAVDQYLRALQLNPNYVPATEGLEELPTETQAAIPRKPAGRHRPRAGTYAYRAGQRKSE